MGLDKEVLEFSSDVDDDVPSAGVEEEQPSSASKFFAALFPSNVGLSLTMTAVMLSIPVPSFIVSGARQCSNNSSQIVAVVLQTRGIYFSKA